MNSGPARRQQQLEMCMLRALGHSTPAIGRYYGCTGANVRTITRLHAHKAIRMLLPLTAVRP